MFGSIKKKLSSAIHIIISESLEQQVRQRVSTPSTPLTPTRLEESVVSNSSSSASLGAVCAAAELGLPPNVNVAAGCSLLAKYEDDWKAIHDANDANAEQAARIAAQIELIEQRTTMQRVVMSDLVMCVTAMPALVQQLKTSMQALNAVIALSATVEQELAELQDLCEECELQEFVLQKQCELSQYKQQKMLKLEDYRQKVAAEHQQKITAHENRLRQIQRERQAVFDDAFRCDLEQYKQTGQIPKMYKDTTPEVSLEEVELQDTETKDALEEFLNG